jgi:hypothetical protein
VEAYEESWKEDHDVALRCRDVEEVLAVGIAVFELLRRVEQTWREAVFREVEDFNAEDDAAIRQCYHNWLLPTEAFLGRLPPFERRFGAIEGVAEIRDRVQEARGLLASWQPPALSGAVGLREMQLDEAGATGLRSLLDRAGPPGAPPTRPLRPVPMADASFLKKDRTP